MNLIEQIISKYLEDREKIKILKQKQAEELRLLEEFQAKRETALLERVVDFDVKVFAFFTDLYINGRDGKSEAKKAEANISLAQSKIENWLLKMLGKEGKGVLTEFGTVYKSRKESVTCQDFDLFVDQNMLKDAAKAIQSLFTPAHALSLEAITQIIHDNMHLEMLTKSVRKEAILEIMGEPAKDGSRPNAPPAGVNYVAVQCVGVRKAK